MMSILTADGHYMEQLRVRSKASKRTRDAKAIQKDGRGPWKQWLQGWTERVTGP